MGADAVARESGVAERVEQRIDEQPMKHAWRRERAAEAAALWFDNCRRWDMLVANDMR
jgi:hypothetical protein